MSTWPADPGGDMVPVLEASIEAEQAKQRHPSGADVAAVTKVVLNALDRCDNCGVGAVFRVQRALSGVDRELDFCGHDYRKQKPLLDAQGWTVIGVNPELA